MTHDAEAASGLPSLWKIASKLWNNSDNNPGTCCDIVVRCDGGGGGGGGGLPQTGGGARSVFCLDGLDVAEAKINRGTRMTPQEPLHPESDGNTDVRR